MAVKRIRVLEVLASASVGGGSTHLRALALGLDPDRFEVHVATSGAGPLVQELEAAGIPVHQVPLHGRLNLRAVGPLTALAARIQPDVIHYHGTRAAVPAAIAGTLLGRPRVYTVHGWSFHPRRNPHLELAASRVERLVCGLANRVICVAESDRASGITRGVLSELKSQVVVNGVAAEAFQVPPTVARQVREALGVGPRDYLVALFGRLTHQKGQRDLLLAAVDVLRAHPEAWFLLAGEGEDRAALERQAEAAGIRERVIFAGARSDVPALMAACDLVVLPSLWEGLPICLLEAMAAARPVVATRVDGTPEVVVHGHTGILVPPSSPTALGRAIGYMADHPQLARRYGEMGRLRVQERFQERQMVEAVAAVYRELVLATARPTIAAEGVQ